jgi:hypothetical protein
MADFRSDPMFLMMQMLLDPENEDELAMRFTSMGLQPPAQPQVIAPQAPNLMQNQQQGGDPLQGLLGNLMTFKNVQGGQNQGGQNNG